MQQLIGAEPEPCIIQGMENIFSLFFFVMKKKYWGVAHMKTFCQQYSVPGCEAEARNTATSCDGVSMRTYMLLSTWTEYEVASLFGGSL